MRTGAIMSSPRKGNLTAITVTGEVGKSYRLVRYFNGELSIIKAYQRNTPEPSQERTLVSVYLDGPARNALAASMLEDEYDRSF